MRGALSIQGVSKSYGDVQALSDVCLEVRPGELLTLLGPSGCGKTTLLRLLAGFEPPDAGAIRISGRDVAGLPPYKRPVNTVFQHYALFPHRTVAGNVAFGLEMKGVPRAEVPARVARALEMVRLAGLGERRIEGLSGGQKQRVAFARAVVLEPEVLLLDEPLAALDRKLREEMQVELKDLQERLRTTFVFVTHDQDEALVMSDRIAVMSRGRIEQLGAPDALYERPRTRFVADFLGVKNILQAEVASVAGGTATLRTPGGLTVLAADDGGYRPGTRVAIGIRAERMSLDGRAGADEGAVMGGLGQGTRIARETAVGEGEARFECPVGPESPPSTRGAADSLRRPVMNRLPGRLDDELYLGDRTDWRVALGGETVTVAESASGLRERRRGEPVTVAFPASAVLRLEES